MTALDNITAAPVKVKGLSRSELAPPWNTDIFDVFFALERRRPASTCREASIAGNTRRAIR